MTEQAGAAAREGTRRRYEWMFWDMGYREESWPV